MKRAFPIVLSDLKDGYVVYIPDFDTNTEGNSIAEAMEMARDAIGILGITYEDANKPIPEASDAESIKIKKDEIVTYVDVDFTDYRRKNEMRTVKKNCTLPSWLCYEAEKANINFSQLLQNAIKNELKIAN